MLGTHGQYNIGDELLLETFLARFGDQHHYVVNTYDPAFTGAQLAGRYDVELIDTRDWGGVTCCGTFDHATGWCSRAGAS